MKLYKRLLVNNAMVSVIGYFDSLHTVISIATSGGDIYVRDLFIPGNADAQRRLSHLSANDIADNKKNWDHIKCY